MNRNRRTGTPAPKVTCPTCGKRADKVNGFDGKVIVGPHTGKGIKAQCYGVGLALAA